MKSVGTHSKTKIFAFGAILVSAVAVMIFFVPINTGNTDAGSDFEHVPVNETIVRGGVAVTLESLRLGEDETQLTYSYSSAPGELVEPLGLPRIDLPDGNRLETEGGGAFDGAMNSGTRTFELPPIPEGVETVSADLASFIVHVQRSTSVEIPLGDLLEGMDLNGIDEREELPLDVEFSVGPAQYRITSLLLDPASFTLVCEPANETASRTVLGGRPSSIRLTDDQENTYSSFLSGAEWGPADDGGQVMTYQGLYFDGLPSPDTTSFSMHLDGAGEIKAPVVFQVDIPGSDGTD